MTNSRFRELFNLCIAGKASADERQEFLSLVELPENEGLNIALIEEHLSKEQDNISLSPDTTQEIVQAIVWADKQNQPVTSSEALKSATSDLPSDPYPPSPVHRIHFLKTTWFRYAAVLLLIAGTATFLYLNNRPQKETAKASSEKVMDIQPGGNKAVLTLSDGTRIVLDSAQNGNLANQGTTKIVKLDAGSLAYTSDGKAIGVIGTNTITTPKGGQYQVILPDGTKVWLNAASSVTFPASFVKERQVTVTGEAYFEVAADKTKPFYVVANQSTIEVLGTSFNINAYTDEPVTATTLINGRVRVRQGGAPVLLQPGEQVNAAAGQPLRVVKGDIEKVIAWKNGLFNFEDVRLKEVMRQLARWYDVEVSYAPNIRDMEFWGKMGRNLTLSQVLKGLEGAGFHFKISDDGKRLIVVP